MVWQLILDQWVPGSNPGEAAKSLIYNDLHKSGAQIGDKDQQTFPQVIIDSHSSEWLFCFIPDPS
jgi:hypothetical protein